MHAARKPKRVVEESLAEDCRDLARRSAGLPHLRRVPIYPEPYKLGVQRRIGRRLRPTELGIYGALRAALRMGFPGYYLSNRQAAKLIGCCPRSVGRAYRSLGPHKPTCAPECREHVDLVRRVPVFVNLEWTDAAGNEWDRFELPAVTMPGRAAKRPGRPRRPKEYGVSFVDAARGRDRARRKLARDVNGFVQGGGQIDHPTAPPDRRRAGPTATAQSSSRDAGDERDTPLRAVSPEAGDERSDGLPAVSQAEPRDAGDAGSPAGPEADRETPPSPDELAQLVRDAEGILEMNLNLGRKRGGWRAPPVDELAVARERKAAGLPSVAESNAIVTAALKRLERESNAIVTAALKRLEREPDKGPAAPREPYRRPERREVPPEVQEGRRRAELELERWRAAHPDQVPAPDEGDSTAEAWERLLDGDQGDEGDEP